MVNSVWPVWMWILLNTEFCSSDIVQDQMLNFPLNSPLNKYYTFKIFVQFPSICFISLYDENSPSYGPKCIRKSRIKKNDIAKKLRMIPKYQKNISKICWWQNQWCTYLFC